MTELPITVPVYRIENPNISKAPDGVISHEDLVGQWFSPDLERALGYLHKSTQTFGRDSRPVDGAQLVVAHVPADRLEEHHVSRHPIASRMDVEPDNYIIPRHGSTPIDIIPLDQTLGELRGRLGVGHVANRAEARRRIHALLGNISVVK